MKLIMSIVNTDDRRNVVQVLLEKGFRTTIISTTGGFLREGNSTILCGVEDSQVDTVLEIIRENCHARIEHVFPLPPVIEAEEFYWATPVEVEVGGATIFIFDVHRFEQF